MRPSTWGALRGGSGCQMGRHLLVFLVTSGRLSTITRLPSFTLPVLLPECFHECFRGQTERRNHLQLASTSYSPTSSRFWEKYLSQIRTEPAGVRPHGGGRARTRCVIFLKMQLCETQGPEVSLWGEGSKESDGRCESESATHRLCKVVRLF